VRVVPWAGRMQTCLLEPKVFPTGCRRVVFASLVLVTCSCRPNGEATPGGGIVDDTASAKTSVISFGDGKSIPVLFSREGSTTCSGTPDRRAEIVAAAGRSTAVGNSEVRRVDVDGPGGSYRFFYLDRAVRSPSFWYVMCLPGVDELPDASCLLSGIANDVCFDTHVMSHSFEDAKSIAESVSHALRTERPAG
jgi:hypothetical protein